MSPLRSIGPESPLDPQALAQKAREWGKANREFQQIFLAEFLRPLTEALSKPSEEEGLFSSNGLDTYSVFFQQGLAKEVAGRWPLPSLPSPPVLALGGQTPATPTQPFLPLPGVTPISLFSAAQEQAGVSLPGGIAPTALSPGHGSATPAVATTGTRAPDAADALRGRTPDALPELHTSAVADASEGRAVAPPLAGIPALPEDEVARASRLFDLPRNLIRAVILTESSGRPDAVSPAGAKGYMQLMPGTAKEMGIDDPSDPWQNIFAGAKYLSRQLERFGRIDHALAAYNAGPGNVAKHDGIPPFRETQAYVRKVLHWKERLDAADPTNA
ncbi:MAG: transglycosylase SLT domain-containing protein [Candidatus Eisenbacteria bacterium]|nr:transglycosylase SLT domain-containing protein [Candidatus Eisenbacteria bacterium]